MQKSKLILLLKCLEEDELLSLEQYLTNRFPKTLLLTFFLFLKKHYPYFPKEKISKQAAYKKLYQNKMYNDVNMRFQISYLYKTIEA